MFYRRKTCQYGKRMELAENGMYTSVSGQRRVHNVQVLDRETGEYKRIDPEKNYTLASNDYMLHECGDGFTLFEDNVFVRLPLLEIFSRDVHSAITLVSAVIHEHKMKGKQNGNKIL